MVVTDIENLSLSPRHLSKIGHGPNHITYIGEAAPLFTIAMVMVGKTTMLRSRASTEAPVDPALVGESLSAASP